MGQKTLCLNQRRRNIIVGCSKATLMFGEEKIYFQNIKTKPQAIVPLYNGVACKLKI